MKHLRLVRKKDVSSFRKLAIGSWSSPDDPTVYGSVSIRMDAALAFLADFERRTRTRASVLDLCVKGAALALRHCPDANAVLWGKALYLRTDISVSVQRWTPEGAATWSRLERADSLSLREIAEAPERGARSRAGTWGERLRAFLLGGGEALDSSSVEVVQAEGWGLDVAYLPLAPSGGAPIVIALGPVLERPLVEGGAVTSGRMMQVHATFDHRFIDGFHASVLARSLKEVLEDPRTHLPEEAGPGAAL